MELVDKPGCKSAVWKHFSLRCDEEKRPVIYGYAFCRECKNKIATHNGNTSNLIVHLRNNHPNIYTVFAKQKAAKAKQNQSTSATSQQKSITETLVSSQPYDQKSKKWMKLTNSITYCIAKDMLSMYTVEKPGFRRMLAVFDK